VRPSSAFKSQNQRRRNTFILISFGDVLFAWQKASDIFAAGEDADFYKSSP